MLKLTREYQVNYGDYCIENLPRYTLFLVDVHFEIIE